VRLKDVILDGKPKPGAGLAPRTGRAAKKTTKKTV
jgi:hypothetical protein